MESEFEWECTKESTIATVWPRVSANEPFSKLRLIGLPFGMFRT